MIFLTATKAYQPNNVIIALGKTATQKDNPGRIQIDNEYFILPPQDIYHSCDPNAYIDWKTMELKAKRNISSGITITYHYGTSEDDYSMAAFACNCGSTNCVRYFRGCKYLTKKQRNKIKHLLSPFLQNKYFGKRSTWFVYILLCQDASLYTGISNNPQVRFREHLRGKGGAYTRSHKPIKILYLENVGSKSEALKREMEIKRWPREKKINALHLSL